MMMGLIDFDPILHDKSPSHPSSTISGLFGKVNKSSRHQAPLSFDTLGARFDGTAQKVSASVFGFASGVAWVIQFLVIDPLIALTKEKESSGLVVHVNDIDDNNVAGDDNVNVKGNPVVASILPRHTSHNPRSQPPTPSITKPSPPTELTLLLNSSTERNYQPDMNLVILSNLNSSSQPNPTQQPKPKPTQKPKPKPTQKPKLTQQPKPTPPKPTQQPNLTPPGYDRVLPSHPSTPPHVKPSSDDPSYLVTSTWQATPLWSTQLLGDAPYRNSTYTGTASRTNEDWEPASLFNFTSNTKTNTPRSNHIETSNAAVTTKSAKINPYSVKPLDTTCITRTLTTSSSPPLTTTIIAPPTIAVPTPPTMPVTKARSVTATAIAIPPTTHTTSTTNATTATTTATATTTSSGLQEQTPMWSGEPTLIFDKTMLWRGASSWVSNIF